MLNPLQIGVSGALIYWCMQGFVTIREPFDRGRGVWVVLLSSVIIIELVIGQSCFKRGGGMVSF